METEKYGLDISKQVDKFEKHGINPDIQQRRNTEDKGVVEADNNYSITTSMDNDDESLKSQSDRFKGNNVDEQIGPNLHGPTQPKLKSTWTRIMRMDYGLGSIIRATDTPLLGKRGSMTDTHVTIPDEKEEAQRVKREKLFQINDDESARVDGHPCRRQ